MNREALDQQNYATLEEKLVTKIENSIFTMTITDIKAAYNFLKNELISLSERYPNTFSIEKRDNEGLILSFPAEEKRYEAYGFDKEIYIQFYQLGTDKRLKINVGALSSIYRFERSDNRFGYRLVEENNGEDNFGLVGVPVNKLLVTTLLEKLSGPIDSLIFGAAK